MPATRARGRCNAERLKKPTAMVKIVKKQKNVKAGRKYVISVQNYHSPINRSLLTSVTAIRLPASVKTISGRHALRMLRCDLMAAALSVLSHCYAVLMADIHTEAEYHAIT
jgi:hypothetical protein